MTVCALEALDNFVNAVLEVKVLYGPSHVGHEADLRHIPLTKQEREQVAEFLKQGCSMSDTLQKVRELLTATTVVETSRLHFLNRQDLKNIVRDFRIKNVKRNDSNGPKTRRSRRALKPSSHSRLRYGKAKLYQFGQTLPAQESNNFHSEPLMTQPNQELEDHLNVKPGMLTSTCLYAL